MDEKDKNRQDEWPDEDHVVCIPDKDIRTIGHVIRNIEQAQQEFRRIRDSMKPLDNGETAFDDSQLNAEL